MNILDNPKLIKLVPNNITIKNDDLLNAQELMLVHGCNAQGVMGSGVALAIREKYPLVFKRYREEYLLGMLHLGHVVFTTINGQQQNKIVANIISQVYYGKDGKKYASYGALVDGFRTIQNQCYFLKLTTIAMPWIGCGFGGLKKEIVQELIHECFCERGIDVVVYERN